MNKTTRSSSDLYFVSYAYAKGLMPSSVQGDSSRKIFYFSDARFDELSTKYYSREGTIEPIAFTNAIRNVKALIYNQ